LFARDSYFSVDYADQSVSSAQLLRKGEGLPEIAPRVVDVQQAEPLKAELEAFIAACRGEPSTAVDGRTGRDALAVAVEVREQVEAR
jgi:predicted dehydrogenase